jgi:DNA transformation protein and related proteins
MSTAPKIRNVGPKSAAWLRQVGVRTEAEVKELGAMEVFMKVKKAGFKPSLNLLYALEGAVQDCHWTALDAERKSELVLAVSALEEGKGPKSWGWWRPGKGTSEVRTEGSAPTADSDSLGSSGESGEDDHGVRELGEPSFGGGDGFRDE